MKDLVLCAVCLGTASLFCEQCSRFYCKECNARRHSRLPDHQVVRLSQALTYRPTSVGGEN